MNQALLITICTSLAGALASIRRDWQSYRDEKKLNPNATFDWGISAFSALEGFLIGLVAGLAGNSLAGEQI